MSNANILSGLMFDAFRQAEHLAHANPNSHAVVYKGSPRFQCNK